MTPSISKLYLREVSRKPAILILGELPKIRRLMNLHHVYSNNLKHTYHIRISLISLVIISKIHTTIIGQDFFDIM